MVRRTNPSDDDWHNVQDAKKRKQIQDRLAQRARRKRLREAKNNAKRGPPQRAETSDVDDGVQQPRRDNHPSQDLVSSAGIHPVCSSSSSSASGHDSAELSRPNFEKPDDTELSYEELARITPFDLENVPFSFSLAAPSPSHQPNFPLTVYGALYINGQILGIPCSTVVPAKSQPAGPEVPLPLRPTELQLITIHPRWIDRIPFPKMRDALISLSGVVDDEELLRDVALMPSFSITPGRAPWDPRAWKIEKPFAEKWGYLFF